MNEAQRAHVERMVKEFALYPEGPVRRIAEKSYAAGAADARDEEIERFSRKYAHALWDTYCLCETMDDPFRSAAHVVIDEINFRATGHHFDAEAILTCGMNA